MKKLSLVFCFILILTGAYGQLSGSIRGRVVENSSGDPLEFVLLILRSVPDTNTIQVTSSDSSGYYMFHNLKTGDYRIDVSLFGFESFQTAEFVLLINEAYKVKDIRMIATDFKLDQIEVTSLNPVSLQGIDRKIYFPEQDLQSQSGTVSDFLQSIPSISVEAEGEIFMRGSENITFLLNGKPSGLLKNNPSIVLAQIPANTIERIEVITNPSAKYKPDGTAGIINIVMKKNVIPGFNGSISGNASTNQRYNGNLALNYNPGKINISGLYGYWQSYNPRTFTDFRKVIDGTGEEINFDLRNIALGRPRSHTATISIDYQPNDKNSASLSGTLFDLYSARNSDVITLEKTGSGILNDFSTSRMEIDNESEYEISLSAEHQFKKADHSISLEAEYADFRELEDSRFKDMYRFPLYPEFSGRNRLNKSGHSTFFSADYVNPINEDLEIEAGYEGEFSAGDLDYISSYLDDKVQIWKIDAVKTNRFLYSQDIHALYGTLSKNFESFEFLAGIRAEQTIIESNLVTLDSMIPNSYFKLFPTLHLLYEIDDKQEVGFSYSRRVNRPDADELNPFPEYVDVRDIEAGNPLLKPEQVHSFELAYHFRNDHITFLPTLYFRNVFDAFTEEVRYINDSTLLTTIENLDQEISGGLEMTFAWNPSRAWNMNLNSNLFYQQIDATDLGYVENKSTVATDTKLAVYLQMFPSTRLQLNSTFRSSLLTSQGRSLPVYFVNAGLKQDLFKKKASLSITVSDVFNSLRWQYIIDTPLLYQKVTRKRKSQVVYLGFTYHFGFSNKKNGEELIFDTKM